MQRLNMKFTFSKEKLVEENNGKICAKVNSMSLLGHSIFEKICSTLENKKVIEKYQINLAKDWGSAFIHLKYNLDEIINNSIDAWIAKSLTKSFNELDEFQIYIVVSTDNMTLNVDVKDNGCGINWLPGHAKTNPYYLLTQRIETKSEKNQENSQFLGGQNIGLFRLMKTIKEENGQLYMKNRKKGGASITLNYTR